MPLKGEWGFSKEFPDHGERNEERCLCKWLGVGKLNWRIIFIRKRPLRNTDYEGFIRIDTTLYNVVYIRQYIPYFVVV